MRIPALVACFLMLLLFVGKLYPQNVTVTSLAPGMYSVSSPAGTTMVSVLPLGGGAYSFLTADGSALSAPLASGTYSIRYTSGASAGIAYVYSLGGGRYSFSNPTTGETGTVMVTPTAPQSIPLPALAVQPPSTNNANSTLLLVVALKQQCDAKGGTFYKGRCQTPGEIQANQTGKLAEKAWKQFQSTCKKSKLSHEDCLDKFFKSAQ